MPRYSIIIPAYNEGARLGATLDHVLSYVAKEGWDAEIIVVNDGSRDQTPDLVRERTRQHPNLRLLENPGNRGKGYSVRNGMLDANGEVLLFSDADLSELQGHRQSLLRQIYGRIFNLLLRIFLGLGFKDTQCGFKAFTRSAVRDIFPLQRIERWGFDPELLFLARKSGLNVKEVAVVWSHAEGTRISPLRDGMRMFLEVLQIRWNALTGKYSAQQS